MRDSILLMAAFAGLLSVISIWVCLKFRDHLPVDHPNHRSLHARPTPRIGGIGIFFALLIGTFLFNLPRALTTLALLLAVLSFIDDRRGLPVLTRFLAQIVAATLVVTLYGGLGLTLLAIPALVWITNLYNFMDGSDGLAGGQAVIGFGALAFIAHAAHAPDLTQLALLTASAALGFLIFNFPPARIFMGDIGSIALGFLAGGLAFIGTMRGTWPFWFVPLVFAPFVLDASVTLLRRLLRGEKIWRPHREHYYQRLILSGWSHRQLALYEYGLMALCALVAIGLLNLPPTWQYLGLGLSIALFGLLMRLIDLHVRHKGIQP